MANLPCAANPARHVRDIEGKQAIVVGCSTYDTHAVPAGPGRDVGVVDAYVDKAVVGIDVAIVGCDCLIDVIYITTGRVG